MKITFLGTGTSQGVPVIGCKCRVCDSVNPKDKRLRCSVMVEIEEEGNFSLKGGKDLGIYEGQRRRVKRFIIDTGPDFRQQMLRERVDHIEAVIYTHDHRDHVAGLDDIRGFNFIMQKSIGLYATKAVQQGIKDQFGYIFRATKYPGLPQINFHTIENKPFSIEEVQFTPILVKHLHLDVFGFRIENPARPAGQPGMHSGGFTYITDANFISEQEKEKIIGSEVLVLNALRKEAHPSHFTFDEAIKLAHELKCKTTYLTHISHQLGLHEEVEENLPDNIRLAYDGMKIHLSPSASPRGKKGKE